MNMHDVVPLEAPKKVRAMPAALAERVRDYRGVETVLGRHFKSPALDQFQANTRVAVIDAAHAGHDMADVPEGLNGSIAVKIQTSPRVLGATVLRLMDALGFALVPYDYLHPDAFKDDAWAASGVRGFNSALKPVGYKVYILVPPHYYSPRAHLRAKDTDQPIYGGGTTAPTLSAVATMIPLLRHMQDQVDTLGSRLNGIDRKVGSLEARVTEVEHRGAALDREALRAARERAVMQAELTALKERELRAWEPMALAYWGDPLDGKGAALVGPCWGPDFHKAILPALGWDLIKGQRAALTEASSIWCEHARY